MHYMVFGSVKRPLGGGGSYLDWTVRRGEGGLNRMSNIERSPLYSVPVDRDEIRAAGGLKR